MHYRRAQFGLVDRLRLSQREHELAVRAIEANDPDGAYAAMKAHIDTVRTAAATFLAPEQPDVIHRN